MQVRELMTRDVYTISPNHTLQEAARLMQTIDSGFLPVADDDRLVGTITDRDITIRAVAEGLDPQTPVSQILTKDVKYCMEDEDIEDLASNMAEIQVRRLPVVNADKRLVGVISLGDLAVDSAAADAAEKALSGVSQPGAHRH